MSGTEEKPDVVLVTNRLQEAIYVNGELRAEGEPLSTSEIIEVLIGECRSRECDDNWLASKDCKFPTKLEEVKF